MSLGALRLEEDLNYCYAAVVMLSKFCLFGLLLLSATWKVAAKICMGVWLSWLNKQSTSWLPIKSLGLWFLASYYIPIFIYTKMMIPREHVRDWLCWDQKANLRRFDHVLKGFYSSSMSSSSEKVKGRQKSWIRLPYETFCPPARTSKSALTARCAVKPRFRRCYIDLSSPTDFYSFHIKPPLCSSKSTGPRAMTCLCPASSKRFPQHNDAAERINHVA